MGMLAQKTRLTVADYHDFIDRPENRDRLFELIDGEIVEKMASFEPSEIASEINYHLKHYMKQNPIGYVTGADGGYILSDDYTFMPDAAYISKVSMPEKPKREVLGAPDIAVEVKSPSDSKRAMRRKAEIYLQFGTKIVWLVFPDTQLVEVYMPDTDVIELGINQTLEGGDVLPGFTLAVATLFA